MVQFACQDLELVLREQQTVENICHYLLDSRDFVKDEQRLKRAAVACLQTFSRFNWVCINCDHVSLNPELLPALDNFFSDPVSYLSPVDKHVPAYSKLKHSSLLCFALECLPLFKDSDFHDCIWAIRILMVKQWIIHDSDASIYCEISKRIPVIEEALQSLDDVSSKIEICINLCNVFLWYREVQTSKKYLLDAISYSGLCIDIEGQRGKRTKHQEISKCLLRVNLTRKTTQNFEPGEDYEKVPKNVPLDDEVLLSQTRYDDVEIQSIKLSSVEEAIVCSYIAQMIICGSTEDDLNREEIFYFLEHIITNGRVWSVVYKSLYLRCRQELDNSKKIERAMKQLEELIKEAENSSKPLCYKRLEFFHVLTLDPLWKIKKTLADVLFSLLCTKSALDLYQQLGLWEQIVTCLCRLDRRSEAERVVLDQIESGETPYLLCLLGDVTDNILHYQKAVQISDGKSARAYKSLGDWHFTRKRYGECISYYEDSLKINPIQPTCWSRIAYAYLVAAEEPTVKKDSSLSFYEKCAKAYRRVVEFDYDNFEAWNNLSKAYIKLGKKDLAYKTLQEALKCNFDEWKIWENFLLVSLDIGEFESVINAWHRLIDLKKRYFDDELMKIVVKATLSLKTDSQSPEEELHRERFIKKLIELIGRISTSPPLSTSFWLGYANLLASIVRERQENLVKIVHCVTKSFQDSSDWKDDPKLTLEICGAISRINENFVNRSGNDFYSFELHTKSFIKAVENNTDRWGKDPWAKDIRESISRLKSLFPDE